MNSTGPLACIVCGSTEELMRCSRCKEALYCSKEHQRQDWKNNHRLFCNRKIPSLPQNTDLNRAADPTEEAEEILSEGSSEAEIMNECAQNLNFSFDPNYSVLSNTPSSAETFSLNTMPAYRDGVVMSNPEVSLPPYLHNNRNSHTFANNSDQIHESSLQVVEDMNKYGVCVLDNFLGKERGMQVLNEVREMYNLGIFRDGQLVSSSLQAKSIRGDQITWIDGTESGCSQINQLIQKVDAIIMRANKMQNNGKMGEYTINGRTKAMVACYPGSGTHYVKHVDNPNKDGRCITAIYYLNLEWDINTCGGLLRIFPKGCAVAIEPKFDRVLFFWSDRRNPHEVQASFRTRFAITLWYFDAIERREATRRHREKAVMGQQPK